MGVKLTFYRIGLLGFLWAVSPSLVDACRLEMVPADGLMVTEPGRSVSFACIARCFGRLSRGDLRWRDNSGNVVTPNGNQRIHAVGYNQWTTNRLMIRSALPSDRGMYICEITHRGRTIEYFASLHVEDYPEPDRNNGPRRGDIDVETDPEFGQIRPAREASRDPGRHYRSRQRRPRPPPEVEEPLARIRRQAAMQPPGVTSDDILPNVTGVGMTTEDGVGGQTSVQPKGVTTTPLPPPPHFPKSTPPHSQAVTKTTLLHELPVTTTESESSENKTSASQRKHMTTTPQEDEDKSAMNKTMESSSPGQIPGSQDFTSSASSSTDSDHVTAEGSKAVGSGSGSSTVGSRSGYSTAGGRNTDQRVAVAAGSEGESEESDFGRYGLLAFCLALAVILLLLVAILLFFLLPRCCGHSGMAIFGRGEGDKAKSKDNEAVLLGERPHKPLAPMTSATGLNGEFITPVDLDGKEEEGEEEGEAGETTPNGLPEAQKASTDPADKPKESYVSTFLIGRLSSSKAEDAPVVAGSSAPLEDNVFNPATSTPDVGDNKKEKKKEKKEKGDDSSSSSSDEDEDSKPSSLDHSKDPSGLDPGKVTSEPTSVDGSGGLMAEIHLQIDPLTGISVENAPHTEV